MQSLTRALLYQFKMKERKLKKLKWKLRNTEFETRKTCSTHHQFDRYVDLTTGSVYQCIWIGDLIYSQQQPFLNILHVTFHIKCMSMLKYSIIAQSRQKATLLDGSKYTVIRYGVSIHHSCLSTNKCCYCTQESAEI